MLSLIAVLYGDPRSSVMIHLALTTAAFDSYNTSVPFILSCLKFCIVGLSLHVGLVRLSILLQEK